MTFKREAYGIVGREVDLHDTGYHDQYGRHIEYETTIEAIADPEAPTVPRSWRVWGRSLRNGRPLGRAGVPLHVYTIADARAMAKTLYHKHQRYIERTVGRQSVRAAAAEETLAQLTARRT